MSGISFCFFDGIPVTFLNQSLFIVSMPAKLLKYDLSRFAIVCRTVAGESRFCACILTFYISETYYAGFQVLSLYEKFVFLLVFFDSKD